MKALRGVLALLMLAGSALTWFAFFGAPNMARISESGPGWMVERAREQPLEGVLFVALPLFAAAQLAAGMALLRGRGGPWLPRVAMAFLGLVLLGAALMLVAGAGAAAAGGAH